MKNLNPPDSMTNLKECTMEQKHRLPKKLSYYLRRREEFNILYPSESVFEISNAFKLVPEIVMIDTDPAAGDIWKMGERQKENGRQQVYALTNRALQRIAQAAEITFDPGHTYRTDDGRNPRRVEYQASGALRKPDGQWLIVTQAKEIDLDVVESEIRTDLEEEAEHGDLKATRNGIEYTLSHNTPECAREINHRVSAKMLLWQKNKIAFAITGAYKRVIRTLLLIKDFYTMEELQRPFVVPRVSLDTDLFLEDVEIKKRLISDLLVSSANVFGPPTESPVGNRTVRSPMAVQTCGGKTAPRRRDQKNALGIHDDIQHDNDGDR